MTKNLFIVTEGRHQSSCRHLHFFPQLKILKSSLYYTFSFVRNLCKHKRSPEKHLGNNLIKGLVVIMEIWIFIGRDTNSLHFIIIRLYSILEPFLCVEETVCIP